MRNSKTTSQSGLREGETEREEDGKMQKDRAGKSKKEKTRN